MSKDIIYRDDGIKAIESDLDEIDALDPDAGIMKACIRRAVWKLMGVPSADRPQGWIPCSERLPKEGERILVTAALERVMVAHYGKMFFEKERGNVFYLAGEDGDADITDVVVAWMPLPEPYKEVK